MNPSVETVRGSTLMAARFELSFATDAKKSRTDSRDEGDARTRFERMRNRRVCVIVSRFHWCIEGA